MRAKTFLAALLLLASLSALAQPPIIEPISVFPKPFGDAGVFLSMGWYNDTQAWFYCTATNDLKYTGSVGFVGISAPLTLAPKLTSALVPRVPGGDIAAQPVYFVTDLQNPPIFSAAPGQPLYSALWQIFTVTWLPGVTPRRICNSQPASPTNPTGLPGPAEASIMATQVVIDCPIVALGPLKSPFPIGGPGYLIPQAGIITNPQLKLVFLPAWQVYCQNPITKRVQVAFIQITDVGDPALASVLGANLAPGLRNLPDSDTSDFFVTRGPKPLTQLPIVSDCPALVGPHLGTQNINFGYSPVMRYVILKRNMPASTTVTSPSVVDLFLSNGCLEILKDDQRINTKVLGPG